jgi:hypothetical protein
MFVINTIKNELFVIFVPLSIIVYPVILNINPLCRFDILVKVHLQVCYKASVIWILNYVLKYNGHKNNTFLTYVKCNVRVYPQIWYHSLP